MSKDDEAIEAGGELFTQALDGVAQALEGMTQAHNEGLSISISELSDRNGENYFLEMCQMQEQLVQAQYEQASAIMQANTIAVMSGMGMIFDASGGLGEANRTRLNNALDLIADVSTRLHTVIGL